MGEGRKPARALRPPFTRRTVGGPHDGLRPTHDVAGQRRGCVLEPYMLMMCHPQLYRVWELQTFREDTAAGSSEVSLRNSAARPNVSPMV